MAAKLLYRQKFIYPDGAIREMVLWQLPRPTKDRPHGLKYRLYYGLADGAPAWCVTTMKLARVIIGMKGIEKNRTILRMLRPSWQIFWRTLRGYAEVEHDERD